MKAARNTVRSTGARAANTRCGDSHSRSTAAAARSAAAAMAALAPLCLVAALALLTAAVASTAAAARRSSALPVAAPLTVAVTVRRGDTLWSLARRYGDPGTYILERIDALAAANGLSSSASLQPGQRLMVTIANPVELAKRQQYLAKN